ncbi:MAG: type VI secretion system tip protein VgrG [Myxococcales bacterium]|nr:type VI secretion system tip protein VgrG [Myxococcales bacterium]
MSATDSIEARFTSDSFAPLQIRRLRGRETLGRPFELEIEAVGERAGSPQATELLGREVAIVLERAGEPVRHFHGMIAEAAEPIESEADTRSYRLRLVPRAFRLSLVEIQEIYMDVSIPDILRQKLEQVQLAGPDVEFRLSGSYPPREFVVQYRESDLAFVSRLAEHYGLTLFYRHDAERECLVVTDGDGFRPPVGCESLPLRLRGEARGVFELVARSKLIPANYLVQDYNYRTPQIDLGASYASEVGFAGGVIEYGTHYKTRAEGQQMARIRAEEREATRVEYSGRSDASELYAGATFRLEGHGAREDRRLLVVEVDHDLVQSVAMHGGGDEPAYANRFRAIDAGLRYRPPRVTLRPRIPGLLTGIVEQAPDLPPAEYARIDDDGRYTVKFLYDTVAPGTRKASRPVRMLQPHAGTGYGMHFPLKPGVEVALAFVDGDPDRPMIVGAVPNPETPSPVTAANSLSNTMKTASGIVFEMKDR